jgi:hypothetical protein
MGAPVTLVSAGNQANPAGVEIGTAANPMFTSAAASSNSASAGIYRRAAAVSATAGDGVFITNVTTAGSVNLTLQNGGVLTVFVALGSTILPLGVVSASLGTAVGGTFQSLFFT